MADMKMGPTIAEILEARKRALGLTNPNSLIPTPGLAAPAIGSAIGQRLGLSTPTTSPIDESINFKLSEISKNPDIAAIQGKEFPKTNPEIPPEVIQSLSKTPETEELPQEIPTYRLPEKKESFWDRPQTLTALKDIAEGGMGVANAMERASLIRIGMNPNAAQHGVAENIRRRIDEREETLSPEERASFQKTLGFDLPQGVTYSKLRMISPLIAQSLRSNMSISPYQKARLEQEEKRLTQSASRLTQGQQRLEMPEKAAIDPIIGYDRILKNIEMVEKGEGPIAQEIGPIASRWNQFKSKIGIESPEWATFRANVYEIVFENLYGKSGKQINEAERADLKQSVLELAKRKVSFDELLRNFKQRVKNYREITLRDIAARGKDVSKFTTPEESTTPPQVPTGGQGKILHFSVDGTEVWGTIDQINSLRKDYPNSVIKNLD